MDQILPIGMSHPCEDSSPEWLEEYGFAQMK
jgi:hypothetical protein